MGFDQENSKRAGSKRAGRASAAIGALLLLAGCMTSGRDTYQTSGINEWLTTENADTVVNAMAAKGMIPATIDCRFADTTPSQLAYLSKFTWKRAPANTRYHWEVGDPTYLASKEVKSNRVGLRRVFAKVVRDPASGQKVGCSIWAS
ncbi:hypothetical protein [Mesorhizobium captivum]|uniref:Lipoprotein n=1 Tax=Mesorhizobium captivum TaxID=3072319 RepID=A0ABU4YXL9_9HYPH|nr:MULTISPECIES: hypothetical protein [unclassified Mesorhizobium]MDX8447914.1 hypothetical protein [Mesorhizobium sp. VK3C]MDX8491715.1 hypothetical protein [Mesorhizobium sp. VK22B]MDX8505025.1 hypothetical protein [Mesorhizobium sp. VK22E]